MAVFGAPLAQEDHVGEPIPTFEVARRRGGEDVLAERIVGRPMHEERGSVRAHVASSFPLISADTAKANATENPTYPMYSIGG